MKKQLKADFVDAMREHNTNKLQEGTQKTMVAKAMQSGGLEANITDRVVFQRFLGHYEILNGYRWHEVVDTDCYLCNNWSYCIFLHDKNIAKDEDVYHSVNTKEIGNMRQKSMFAPSYVSIDSIRQVYPMIPIQHFLSRLAADKHGGGVRMLKDHAVADELKELKEKVGQYENRIRK